MTRIQLILFFIVFSFVSNAQTWEKSVLLEKYSISYPADWVVEMGYDEVDSTLFSIISPRSSENDRFSENVSINKHKRVEIKDIHKEADATIAYLKKEIPDFKLLGKVEFREDKEYRGFTINYSGKADGKPWYYYATMLDDGNYFYSLMFTGPLKEMKKYLPTVKKIYASFKVLQ